MIIYRGNKAVCGIQLTIDKTWRYVLSRGDVLTVKVIDSAGNDIVKTYTAEDVDPIDKMIRVEFSETETLCLEAGRGRLSADVNGYLAVEPTSIYIKEEL
jgi:hypothetical protein